MITPGSTRRAAGGRGGQRACRARRRALGASSASSFGWSWLVACLGRLASSSSSSKIGGPPSVAQLLGVDAGMSSSPCVDVLAPGRSPAAAVAGSMPLSDHARQVRLATRSSPRSRCTASTPTTPATCASLLAQPRVVGERLVGRGDHDVRVGAEDLVLQVAARSPTSR